MKPFVLLRVCQDKQLSCYLHVIVLFTHIYLNLPGWEYFHILEKQARVALALSEDLIEKGLILLSEADLLVKFESEFRVEFDVEGRS